MKWVYADWSELGRIWLGLVCVGSDWVALRLPRKPGLLWLGVTGRWGWPNLVVGRSEGREKGKERKRKRREERKGREKEKMERKVGRKRKEKERKRNFGGCLGFEIRIDSVFDFSKKKFVLERFKTKFRFLAKTT